MNNQTMIDIFNEFNVNIESNLEVLHEDSLFLRNAINLVIGESKAGKTYTTIKSLVDLGFKDNTIHLDFDRNADEKLSELGVKTYHISDIKGFLSKISESNVIDSLEGKILVIDSLQDLSLYDGLDSNSGALETMNKVLMLKETGATIIVIHHITLDADRNIKVKGNSSVITSKSDTTITFIKDTNKRIMKVLNTRAEDKIPSNTIREFTSTFVGAFSVPA